MEFFTGAGRQSDVKVRYTLKKNSDFRRLYAKGKSAASPYLVVYCRKNRLDRSRAGYTVSTKLATRWYATVCDAVCGRSCA